MYESPEYHSMKLHIQHWKNVQSYVDLARTFRSMVYGGDLTLVTDGGPHNMGAHEVTIRDSLRRDALEFLARRCEDLAAKMDAGESPNIDVRAACKV